MTFLVFHRIWIIYMSVSFRMATLHTHIHICHIIIHICHIIIHICHIIIYISVSFRMATLHTHTLVIDVCLYKWMYASINGCTSASHYVWQLCTLTHPHTHTLTHSHTHTLTHFMYVSGIFLQCTRWHADRHARTPRNKIFYLYILL